MRIFTPDVVNIKFYVRTLVDPTATTSTTTSTSATTSASTTTTATVTGIPPWFSSVGDDPSRYSSDPLPPISPRPHKLPTTPLIPQK